ncbi:MAG: ABC transporter ATP-binding protein [Nitrospirae bacterium]|nr:ABC transporter ATP-binding protein [Nitrospirota bacterium]
MLLLKDIHTFYGNIEAVKGIDLHVDKGEIVCLIGSNGAGKSTALMTISGILKPKNGGILFEGEEIHKLPPHQIVSRGISQVPEGRRIFPRLTVMENLEMGAYSVNSYQLSVVRKHPPLIPPLTRVDTGGVTTQLEKVFELFSVLKERRNQLGGTLSGGEQQMLAIGRALMSNPKLLLLDEPSLGLAPIFVIKIFKTIRELNSEGLTILLVEQNAKAALRLANRGYVMESGKVIKEGKGAELPHDADIKKAYLGE